jgi:hypothetical protein
MEGRVQATAIAPNSATETLRGVVDSVDEGHDTLKVRLSQDKTEEFTAARQRPA